MLWDTPPHTHTHIHMQPRHETQGNSGIQKTENSLAEPTGALHLLDTPVPLTGAGRPWMGMRACPTKPTVSHLMAIGAGCTLPWQKRVGEGRLVPHNRAEFPQVWETQDHSLSSGVPEVCAQTAQKLWSSNCIRWHHHQLVKRTLLAASQYRSRKGAESTLALKKKSPPFLCYMFTGHLPCAQRRTRKVLCMQRTHSLV